MNQSLIVEAKQVCGRWLFEPKNNIAKAITKLRKRSNLSEKDVRFLMSNDVSVINKGQAHELFN